jgi:hypothetical protein
MRDATRHDKAAACYYFRRAPAPLPIIKIAGRQRPVINDPLNAGQWRL